LAITGGLEMKLLQDILREVVWKHGDLVAFDSVDGQITFNQLYERIGYLAGALEDLGVNKGERVAILAQNCVEYVAYHYATAIIGAILLPLNIRHTDDEMLWVLNNAESSILIIDERCKSHLPELKSKCDSNQVTIGIGSIEGTDYLTNGLVDGKLSIANIPSISSKDPILLIYTSGTTGRPKGALQNHEGICMVDELTAEEWGATEKDVYLAFLPYFHQAGLLRTRATIIRGGKNIVYGKMDVETLASLMVEKKVSIVILPSAYYMSLSEIADRDNLTFPSLRLLIGLGGTGPIQADQIKAFCDRFNCKFRGVYGQTECSGPATCIMGDDFFNNPFTCGKAREGIELQIWDDNNNLVPAGIVGEIMIRSKTTIPGYWKNDQASKELYTEDWLHTGDLGRLDEEGFLYFVDRKKELIKTGGENVYPREVTNVLQGHPAVSDLTIIGLPDPNKWGEVVTAVVVLKAGQKLTLDEVKVFCGNKIAGYKIPKVLKVVEEIPRNITGKVKKVELREQFAHEI